MNMECTRLRLPDVGVALIESADVSDDRLRKAGVKEAVERNVEELRESVRGLSAWLSGLRDDMLVDLQDKPDRLELEFGLRLDAEVGAVIAKASGQTHLKVTLSWEAREDGCAE